MEEILNGYILFMNLLPIKRCIHFKSIPDWFAISKIFEDFYNDDIIMWCNRYNSVKDGRNR